MVSGGDHNHYDHRASRFGGAAFLLTNCIICTLSGLALSAESEKKERGLQYDSRQNWDHFERCLNRVNNMVVDWPH